jgi:hypothetical protein
MEMIDVSAISFRPKGRPENLTSALMDGVKKGTALIGGFPPINYANVAAGRGNEFAYVNRVGAGVFAELLRWAVIPHAAAIVGKVRQADNFRMEMQFGCRLHGALQPMLKRFGELAGYDRLRRKRKERTAIALEAVKPDWSGGAADAILNWREAVI